MTRLKMVRADTTDAEVAPVFERMRKRWGTVLHLYRLLAWSPPLVKAWGAFAWSLRFEVGASRRLRELLVIHIAQQLGARYELAHHSHMAADEGITDAQIAALPQWRSSDLFDADERLMLQLGDELGGGPGASAATMAQLRRGQGGELAGPRPGTRPRAPASPQRLRAGVALRALPARRVLGLGRWAMQRHQLGAGCSGADFRRVLRADESRLPEPQ
jgi:AhpD family alkylhydroperoxidase